MTYNGAAETPYGGAADPWSDGPAGRKARFLDAVAFEWIKVSTVRSTWWTLFAAAFITISIGAFAGSGADPGSEVDFVLREIYVGLPIGQLAICLFGALAATSEYGTGSIRSTFTAVPKRPRLLAAKALVVFAVSLVTGLLISFATYTAGTLSLGAAVARPELSDGAVLRAVVGGGCYLGVLGVFALIVGLVLRASAGAITACVGLTFILPSCSMPSAPSVICCSSGGLLRRGSRSSMWSPPIRVWHRWRDSAGSWSAHSSRWPS